VYPPVALDASDREPAACIVEGRGVFLWIADGAVAATHAVYGVARAALVRLDARRDFRR